MPPSRPPRSALRLHPLARLCLALAALPAAPAAPSEDLTAPPPVTARAWAIADGRTGELLWSHEGHTPRKAASTTKMMCAYVILTLAARSPAVLDERVTFSALADATPGSTAAIKAGESLTVRDCLRGLLLPSGNDAGNALAEHFHARLAPPDADLLAFGLAAPALATRVNFIAEMNRTARRLELRDTHYRLPYGDGGTDTDRTTTAADLTRLAWHAYRLPAFREIVATRDYECDVATPDGGSRRARWENTNQLLALDLGYDGVKTGTTTLAGQCLVASGRRGGDHLFVVVLGSATDARFVDTRHLFRWAWTQRPAVP
jgi:D-alanyl-D-alanine carboxypeptidase (penicillin-binding protein 5/6)